MIHRGRKRYREESLDGLLDQLEELAAAAEGAGAGQLADPQSLIVAMKRLQQLQANLEKRLAKCAIDNLTSHDAIRHIYRRRVRLVKVVINEFRSDSDAETDSASDQGTAKKALADRASNSKARKKFVAKFMVGKEMVELICGAERPGQPEELGSGGDSLSSRATPRFSCHLRLGDEAGGAVLLHCASWEPTGNSVDSSAWESLHGRFGSDKRLVLDFARDVVSLGVFAELQRKFAREESDSEDEIPGLVSTLSRCAMLAESALPRSEGRLGAQRGNGATMANGRRSRWAEEDCTPVLQQTTETAVVVD